MEIKFHAQVQSLWFRQSLSLWERWHRAAMTERASLLKFAAAVFRHAPLVKMRLERSAERDKREI